MKKPSRGKLAALAALAAVLLAWAFSSRPMTIAQRYPMLTADSCTGIQGYYYDGTQTGFTNVVLEKDSQEFRQLWELFFQRSYRRSLRDLLPRGTRIHSAQPGDFQWEVFFEFENVPFPDGSTGSGTLLHIQNWYGELDLHFDGEPESCITQDQQAWAAEVLDILRGQG